jgi:DNA replication ATP-dependent helicase Dna2
MAGNSDAFRLNSEIDTVLGNIRPHPLPIQKKAIQLALGLKDVLLIQGPPGTGKTYTLALAVKSLVEDGQCVAISTYTHRAADEVMSKLLTLAPDLEVRKLGRPEAVASQYTDRCLSRLFQREESIRNLDRDSLVADLTSRQQSIEDVLSTSAVYIGTTHAWLSGKYDDLPKVISKGEKNQFDVVVIDEASQVITPNLVGAMRLASRWILVGDHKQLPPIVISDNSEILGKTLFESIAEHPDRCKNLLVQLETQHRMPQALADFIGSTFYNNKLYTSNEVAKRNRSIACNITRFNTEHCITLIEVGSESKDTHFKQFAEEADWIADTIKELYDHKWPIRNGSNKPTIGVIAPFRAQVALLRRTLEKRFDGNIDHDFWNDVVDTVDRFQGDEREIIILSLCLSRDDAKVPRVYEDGRRINVALSRAKCKLWVVGCINEMKNIPVLSAFRNYAEAHPDSCAVVTYKKSTSVEELF